jgi:hypothetical protein
MPCQCCSITQVSTGQNTHARHPPNYASLNLSWGFLPRNEVTVNPPIDILDTQTVQQSVPSQLSGPNSHSSNPNNQVQVHQQVYDPIRKFLSPVEGNFSVVKSVVENVFSGCPTCTSPSSPIFRSRPGHLRNQHNWQCNCGLTIQAQKLDDNHNLIQFYMPVGQDLPPQGAPPEPAVQTYSRLSFGVGGPTSQDSELVQDIEIVQQLSDSQKDVIKSVLENQPTIQEPLVCWRLLRTILPQDALFQFDQGGIRGYYLIQAHLRFIRHSTLPIVGFVGVRDQTQAWRL